MNEPGAWWIESERARIADTWPTPPSTWADTDPAEYEGLI